ncbi:MAG: transglycosylase family protein [Acidimicrobiia bacterium]
MTTRRHPSTIGRALATALVAAMVFLAPASLISAAAQSDPNATRVDDPTLARERLDAARALAAAAAERMSAAQSEQADLEVAIARGEAAIPVLRTRADGLRAMVRERAARLYMRLATPRFDAVVGIDNVVDAARAAHLTEAIGDHDQSLATELQNTARELEGRLVQLRAQRAELDRTIAALVPLQGILENRVERAVAAYRAVRTTIEPRGESPDVGISSGDAVWETFRECTFAYESGGNYKIVSPDGAYYGAWQFAIRTWNAVAARLGRDDLVGVLPSQASPADQDAVAHALWLESGNRPWGGRC